MQSPFIICLQISRCISSSNMCLTINREGKFMKKLMYESRKSKRQWYDTSPKSCSINASINPTDKSPSMHTRRRMIIRDKLFMEHITDMMSMGEVSNILKGRDIEITHVKITQDFKYVNVFYVPDNVNDDSFNKEILQKCASIIRHELSQLRIIGVVPPIQFVENKEYLRQKEVERKLAIINSEGDSEILSDNNVDQISHKESVVNENFNTDEFYIQLPIMKHDVLGLDHHKIMSRITSAVSKSKKAAQRRMLDAETNADKSDPVVREVEFITKEEQQKIFSDFLIKKRKEERRRYKTKQSDKQKLLNNFEEEINDEDYEDEEEIIDKDYEDDVNIECMDDNVDDEYNDDFHATQK